MIDNDGMAAVIFVALPGGKREGANPKRRLVLQGFIGIIHDADCGTSSLCAASNCQAASGLGGAYEFLSHRTRHQGEHLRTLFIPDPLAKLQYLLL